jgi:hypothetical protein
MDLHAEKAGLYNSGHVIVAIDAIGRSNYDGLASQF